MAETGCGTIFSILFIVVFMINISNPITCFIIVLRSAALLRSLVHMYVSSVIHLYIYIIFCYILSWIFMHMHLKLNFFKKLIVAQRSRILLSLLTARVQIPLFILGCKYFL